MKTDINFEYIEDFADYIVDRVEEDENLFLTIIGKFEEIKDIIKDIISTTYADFENIDLCSPDVNGYNDEYVLDCYCNNGIVQIGCEPAKRNGEYLNLMGDETYLLTNCSSKIIPLCDESNLYFVNIDDDFNDKCCNCHNDDVCTCCSASKNGDNHGFTAIKNDNNGFHSFSYYTNSELSDDDIYFILDQVGF